MSMVSLGEVDLCYEQQGEGLDIVRIPGGDQRGIDFAEQYESFPDFRNTAFDPRGVGETRSRVPPPWTMKQLARDCAELIRAVCDPPVFLTGLSMGSLIVQQVAIDYPELVRVAIPMGTGGGLGGFPFDWMRAEIEFRRARSTLSGPMAVHHYAVFMYPSEVLGDEKLWQRCSKYVKRAYEFRDGDLLIAQWEACLTYRDFHRLPECRVPIHVIAFSQDCQTPPPHGRTVAEAAGDGHFHLLEGLGHVSLLGHRPQAVSDKIREIVSDYL